MHMRRDRKVNNQWEMQLSTLSRWTGTLIEVSNRSHLKPLVHWNIRNLKELAQSASAWWHLTNIYWLHFQSSTGINAISPQSGRWCALFENFTLQRLAAQIRAGLRWTTAPCQWITHFTAGNQHNYGGNIGDAGILIKELPLRAGRDKLRIDNFKWVTVVLCACATRNVHVVIHAPKTWR